MNDDVHHATSSVGVTVSPSEAAPIPPRYKWLKRFAKCGVLLIIGVIIIRIGWGMIARHRLDALIDSYRAEGQLVTLAEFDAELDVVPDEENAAILYEEAMGSYVGTTKSGVLLSTFLDDIANFESDPIAADEFMRRNSEALAIIRRATGRPHVAWSYRLQDPLGNQLPYTTQRMIARVLFFASAYQILHGDDEAAVDTIHDFVVFNDAIGKHPTRISSLVSWACHGLFFSFLEQFGERLRVSPSALTIGTTVAKRDQLERLIDVLLDERGPQKAAILAFHGDRASYLPNTALYSSMLASSVSGRVMGYVTEPVLLLDILRLVQYETMGANAVGEPTWSAASLHFPMETQTASLIRRTVRPITYVPGYGLQHNMDQRFAWIYFRNIAQRRMAAVALAIKLYEADHGMRPAGLTELVPKYLPELPHDPFSKSEDTFAYKPLAVRPLLYSVGGNGEDDGGGIVRRGDGRRDQERSDITFYLAPEPPEEADNETDSSLETGDHGEQEEQQ